MLPNPGRAAAPQQGDPKPHSRRSDNESERLFEEFCEHNGLRCVPIATASDVGERRPDYRVTGSGGREIIVEIKQFDPNPKERADDQALLAGKVVVTGGIPGQRAREAIDRANPQIKVLARGALPGLLVLYNNVLSSRQHTDPYAILTAMRGLDVVPVEVPPDPKEPPRFLKRRPGPRKKLTAARNRSVSAIGVLRQLDENDCELSVFHNKHATVPLEPTELSGSVIRHFRMADDEDEWIQIFPSA